MADLAELTARLEALRKARANGVRRVKHGDRETEYRGDAELAAAITDLERQVAAASRPPVRTIQITMNKGV